MVPVFIEFMNPADEISSRNQRTVIMRLLSYQRTVIMRLLSYLCRGL